MSTYFFLLHNGRTIRVDAKSDLSKPDVEYKTWAYSNFIIKLQEDGTGITLKNRDTGRQETVSRDRMVMISLQAENYERKKEWI